MGKICDSIREVNMIRIGEEELGGHIRHERRRTMMQLSHLVVRRLSSSCSRKRVDATELAKQRQACMTLKKGISFTRKG